MSFEPGVGKRPLEITNEVSRYDELEVQKVGVSLNIDFTSSNGPDLPLSGSSAPQYAYFDAVGPGALDEDEVAELVAIEREMDFLSVERMNSMSENMGTLFVDHEFIANDFVSFDNIGDRIDTDVTFADDNTDFANSLTNKLFREFTQDSPKASFIQPALGIGGQFKDPSNSAGGGGNPWYGLDDGIVVNYRHEFGRGPLAMNTRNSKSAIQWGADWTWDVWQNYNTKHKAFYKLYWDVFELPDTASTPWELIES